MFPKGLVIVIASLIAGLCVSVMGTKRKRDNDAKSPGVGSTDQTAALLRGNPMPSYQSQAASDYALPTQKNAVTYCVIDDRLVGQE